MPRYVWGSEDSLLTLSFLPVGPGDKTRVIRLGGKAPVPTGPSCQPDFCHFSHSEFRVRDHHKNHTDKVEGGPMTFLVLSVLVLRDLRCPARVTSTVPPSRAGRCN